MEPVELKIITRNETKKGLEEIVRDTGKVGQTVEQVTADFKARMKEQSEVVKQVEADIKSLEQQLSKAAPGKAKLELTADLTEAKKVLAEEKGTLADLEQQVDKSAQKHIALRTEIRNLKEQMAGMTEGTEEYAAAMQHLGTLQDRMGDVGTQGHIFADDNKNIKATMDAVSGLTGAMTAGVGVASLFGMEQEKLSEIQTKLQAVMAITMGVQQVANTLNKDSYFTHVLLAKGKTLLTAANTRLAVSLGISNAAAQALMATLTLGLSVVITGLIVLWNRYSDAQDKAAAKVKERVDIEKDGRAQMIKTRVELENEIRSLKEFNGTKEQEKDKIKELNSKYGEAFGYYKTIAEWYDVLSKKSAAYVQSLFLQAKAQSLINKAVTADEKVNEIDAKPDNSYDTWWGSGGKIDRFFGSNTTKEQNINSVKSALKKEAENERDAYLKEAEDLQKEIAEFNKKNGIGVFIEPQKPTFDKDSKAAEIADSELKARQKINDMTISLMKEGEEQKKKLARKHFDDELARIDQEERDRLKALQNAQKNGLIVSPEQVTTVKNQAKQQRDLAGQQYIKDFFAVEKEYADKSKKLKEEEEQSWIDYNKEYGSFQEQRAAITKDYDNKILNAKLPGEKASLQKKKEEELKGVNFEELKSSINFADIFGNLDAQSTGAISKMRDKLKEIIEASAKDLKPTDLKTLQDAFNNLDLKIAERNPFSELKQGAKNYKASTQAVIQAQEDLNTVMQGGEVITGTYIDSTGKICIKLLTQEQAEKKLATAQSNRQTTLSNLTKAANSIGQKGMEVVNASNQVVGMLENFGVKVPEAVGQTLDGIGQVMNGLESIDLTKPFSAITGSIGILTGIGNTIAGLFGFGGADYSGYEAMKSQYEHLISIWDELIDKKLKYIDINYGTEALKAAEEAENLVNIQIGRQRQLIKQLASSGASVGSHSLGVRIDKRLSKEDYQRLSNLAGEKIEHEYQLWDLSAEQLEKVLTDEKLVSVLDTVNKDFVPYLQNIVAYGDKLDEIAEKEKEAITGMGFDSFRDGYVDLLSDLDSTNEDFADNFEKYLQKAIFQSLVANKYKKQIQSLYDNWAEYGKNGLTKKEIDALRTQQQELTNNMLAEREKLMQDFGWESETQSSSQSGRSGAVTTITEETAGKIEGIATSIQIRIISMDDKMTDIAQCAYDSIGILNTIAENTAFCKFLEEIAESMEKMERDGVKMK